MLQQSDKVTDLKKKNFIRLSGWIKLNEYFKFNHSKFLQNEDLLFESFKSKPSHKFCIFHSKSMHNISGDPSELYMYKYLYCMAS